jgi:signal transduction histidine kinase
MLHDFILANRELIVDRARLRVRDRMPLGAIEKQWEHGVPLFLTQLVRALTRATAANTLHLVSAETALDSINDSAALHGQELLRNGFSVAQVVHGYGDVCQIVTELAMATSAAISADDFHLFNRCLDDAIAGAVTAYGRQRESDLAFEALERRGTLALELRSLLHSATLSLDVLKRGTVALTGSTSAVLARSLSRLSALVERSLAEVLLETGTPKLDRILVSEFIEEVRVGAALQAEALGLSLLVGPVESELEIDADRQLLAAAMSSLLQNAFKFTRVNGKVSILTHAVADRVLLDVWDECGGLAPGAVEELFHPANRGRTDRSGLRSGLSIALSAVRASAGEITARNIAGTGCVFTVDLPRRPARATTS